MKTLRTLKTALRALRRNPMRAALTTLGIIIGVAAVIAMMEIGMGASAVIEKTIADMGASSIMLMPGAAASASASPWRGRWSTIPPSSWPTSLPATWTRRRGLRSWLYSIAFTAKATPSCWSPTSTTSPRTLIA